MSWVDETNGVLRLYRLNRTTNRNVRPRNRHLMQPMLLLSASAPTALQSCPCTANVFPGGEASKRAKKGGKGKSCKREKFKKARAEADNLFH
uniref:Bm7767 n=1 Tax=Brugia malayi TaxID=6279 RepID=A0A0J9Y8Z8_BRUMA|nr:Bm7767 [Brugia malayi]